MLHPTATEEGHLELNDPHRIHPQQQPQDEDGQGLAEYALILALIAIVAILSMIFLGDTIADLMSYIGVTIDDSTLQGG